jgi:hypothetical protein
MNVLGSGRPGNRCGRAQRFSHFFVHAALRGRRGTGRKSLGAIPILSRAAAH